MEELDYEPAKIPYGKYQHVQKNIVEQLGLTTISSGVTMTFILPGSEVFNLAESYLEFVLTFTSASTATANKYLWMHPGCSMFRTFSVQPSSGSQFTLDPFNLYLAAVTPYLTPQTALETSDATQMFFKSNQLITGNKYPANGFNSDVNYNEFQHAINVSNGSIMVANTSIVNRVIRIPFKYLYGTMCTLNRSVCFGQNVNLVFTFDDIARFSWVGTSPFDPSVGVTSGSGEFTVSVSNALLQLAQETNEEIIKQCRIDAAKRYVIEVPCAMKLVQPSISGASQGYSSQLSMANGDILQRIWSIPFNSSTAANKIFDHSNASAAQITTVANNRVLTYQTRINGFPLQPTQIKASPCVVNSFGTSNYSTGTQGGDDDWARMEKLFSGSCILNANVFGQNWAIIDDFTPRSSRLKKNIEKYLEFQGTPLTGQLNNTYEISTTVGVDPNTSTNYINNWFSFYDVLKNVQIGPDVFAWGVKVDKVIPQI